MIPRAIFQPLTVSSLTVFTPLSDCENELFEVLELGIRVARSFARRRFKLHDAAFVEECEAEAMFVLTEVIYGNLQNLKDKYPEQTDRNNQYRMVVGFKLKEYWSHRATSTLRYLWKKGIIQKQEILKESSKISFNLEVQMLEALDHACRNEFERLVIEYYAMGDDKYTIAKKLDVSPTKVKRTRVLVCKRLKTYDPHRHITN